MPKLEEVFKISGVPTHTFVQPNEYEKLFVALRTPGRGVIVEGPSGIGKTSAIETALRATGAPAASTLRARKKADVEYIDDLPNNAHAGLVIIDDFHRLPDSTKQKLSDYLKSLADEENKDTKIVIVGINRAGERLVDFAKDLSNRIDIIKFESNPEHKVRELLAKGSAALNVTINIVDEIVDEAQGSFYIAQLLAHEACVRSGITESKTIKQITNQSFEAVKAAVFDRLRLIFYEPCKKFCQGNRMKSAGRAPYLHIMHQLATARDWSLSLRDLRAFDTLRASVSQVVEKGFLSDLISTNREIRDILHYDATGKTLSIEDPQFVFFIRQISWQAFAKDIGFTSVSFDRKYDFALSFAGADRSVAEAIFENLSSEDISVFYDKNEQFRIIAEDLEEYLRPIYQSEASYVVCLLSKDYPTRIWTKFESEAFKSRFDEGAVIPVRFTDTVAGMFDTTKTIGGLSFDPNKPPAPQVKYICDVLIKKLEESRQ